jgi:transcription antitermination factor NusG
MKEFLAIYIGAVSTPKGSEWHNMDEEKRNKLQESGIKAWGEWMMAKKGAIVDQGGPLGKTKRTAAHGVSDTKNSMTGYVVVDAESHEAAARMFENHPHFTIFPGDSVEIMECQIRTCDPLHPMDSRAKRDATRCDGLHRLIVL